MTWAEIGVRRRSIIQRIAQNANLPDVNHWIETGEITGTRENGPPPEDTPEVHIAKEQIRKDGKVIVENVTRAIEEWRDQHKMSRRAELT